MRLRSVNAISAAISAAAACVWLVVGEPFDALIWLLCSIVWLVLAVAYAWSRKSDPFPIKRLLHRLSRLLIWS